MNKRITMVSVLLAIAVALAACGTTETAMNEETAAPPTIATLNEDYPGALPVSSQLAVGTLLLEGTENGVTEDQAQELLLPWRMLEALQASGNAAQAEIDAVLAQILAAMTPAQVSGAASSGSIPAGTRTTCRAWPTAYSAKLPFSA